MDLDKRLSPNYVWLFALTAIVGGLGISFVTAGMGPKISAGAFFAFVGGLAFLGAYLTSATAFQAIGPFVLASLGLGVVYFAVVKAVVSGAADSVGAGGKLDGAASAMGTVFAVIITLDALAASVGGALFGRKLRSVKSFGELVRRPA